MNGGYESRAELIAGASTLLIVVPTRNRATLAMNAVRSVLGQATDGVRVMVSDNSSDAGQRAILADFCHSLPSGPVEYVTPPSDMSMAAHWEWALRCGLKTGAESHLTFLTDRMVFKDGELATLLGIVGAYPDRVVTYNHDKVLDIEPPIRVEMAPWSGKVFEVDSSHLLGLSARAVFHTCLPRMLNCFVPRTLLEELSARWGTVFDSTAPDFFFAYRCLDSVARIIYYDKACLVQYALDRSNGMSQARGIPSADSKDFEARLGIVEQNYAAPVPRLRTVPNAITHEYCAVRETSTTGGMPEVYLAAYLATNAEAIGDIEDPMLAMQMHRLLREYGRRLPVLLRSLMAVTAYQFPNRARKLQLAVLNPGPTKEVLVRRVRSRTAALEARFGRIRARPPQATEFASSAEAIAYANRSEEGRSQQAICVLPLCFPKGHIREVHHTPPRQRSGLTVGYCNVERLMSRSDIISMGTDGQAILSEGSSHRTPAADAATYGTDI